MSEPTAGAETAAARPVPPPLEFPYPPCTICGEDCEYDGGWYCVDCDITWAEPAHHHDGVWCDAKAAQCPSRWSPFQGREYDSHPALKAVTHRCHRSEGQEGDHVDPGALNPWTDAQADAPREATG